MECIFILQSRWEFDQVFVEARSGHPEVFCKKGGFRNLAKFTEKHLCQSLLFKSLRPATLLRKRLSDRCFPVSFGKFLRTLFFTNNLIWWLLLRGSHRVFGRFFLFYNGKHLLPMLLFYTLSKHQKYFKFSDVFREHRNGAVGTDELKLQTLKVTNKCKLKVRLTKLPKACVYYK